MIHDYFRVAGAHDTVMDFAYCSLSLFIMIMFWKFDTRRNEVLLSVSKIPSDDVLESLYKLRIRESAQPKTTPEFLDMKIHQKISMPNYQKNEDNGEEEYRSETSTAKL